MANVIEIGVKKPLLLDKLAQPPTKGRENLLKRARSKWFTYHIVKNLQLIDSPLQKYYEHCENCCKIITQRGDKFTSKYCNTRPCNICNRIRTGKLINGYLRQIDNFSHIDLVTLTIPNCRGSELRGVIENMIKQMGNIIRVLAERRGIRVNGIRKIETTFNHIWDTYHPHLHLLVDKASTEIVDEWLKRFPDANRKAQDITEADQNSLKEMFKYTTKIAVGKRYDNLSKSHKVEVYTHALDTIFRAMHGKRAFQPFGKIKKVSEEVNEELTAQSYEDMPQYDFVEWIWNDCDWKSPVLKQTLTGYVPPEVEFTAYL